MTGQLGSGEFSGQQLQDLSDNELVMVLVGSEAGYRNEADGALMDLICDRDPDVCDLDPSPESWDRYRAAQAELVRRAVGHLGLSSDFLFNESQGQ